MKEKTNVFLEHPVQGSQPKAYQRTIWFADNETYSNISGCSYVVLNEGGCDLLEANILTLPELEKGEGIASIFSLEKLIKEGWSSIVNGRLF